jgi:hypothetical protein
MSFSVQDCAVADEGAEAIDINPAADAWTGHFSNAASATGLTENAKTEFRISAILPQPELSSLF